MRDRDATIDAVLRDVDLSFSHVRAGRDLDERIDEILDRRRSRSRSRSWTSNAPIAISALSLCFLAAVVTRDPHDVDAPIALAPVGGTHFTVDVTPGAPAPASLAALPAEPRKTLKEELRFIEVPVGRLEVRAPSTVDVRHDRAIVTSGTARLLEKGRPARTLLQGQSIAWKVKTPPVSPGIDDGEVEAFLRRARSEAARGAHHEAADVLAQLLAARPPPRVADAAMFERANLLLRAREIDAACGAFAEHAHRFPASENAPDAATSRARHCR